MTSTEKMISTLFVPTYEENSRLEEIGDGSGLLLYSSVIIEGVEITYEETNIGLHLHRVFIPCGNRGKGLLSKAIDKLCKAADEHKVVLSANIRPDIDTEDNYKKLRDTFASFGFMPVEIDGEIYRNDIERNYTKMSKKK